MRKIALFFCALIGATFLTACGGGGGGGNTNPPVAKTPCEGYWVGPVDTVMSWHSFVLTPKNISSIGYERISTFEPMSDEGKLFIPKGDNFTKDRSLSCVDGVLNVKFDEDNFVFTKSNKELWLCTAPDLLSGWYDTEKKKAYIHLKGFPFGDGYDVTTTSDGVQGVTGKSVSFSCKNPNLGKG